MEITSSNYKGMPPQRIPMSKKTLEWRKRSVDSIISMAGSDDSMGSSTKESMEANYDLVNSRFNPEDFDYVLNPYGAGGKFGKAPTKLQNYNIIRSKLEALKGEEMKMPFNYVAVAVGGEAVSEKNKARNEALKASVIQMILSEVEPQFDEEGNPIQPETPQQVAEKFRTEYDNPTEQVVNKLIRWLYNNDKLQMKFSQGWEHGLISAREIYNAQVIKGHPSLRVCNPLQVSFDKEHDSPFIQDGVWAREERWMPVGTVIDTYGEHLTDEEVKMLDEGQLRNSTQIMNNQLPGFMYDFDGGIRPSTSRNPSPASHVYVANVCWRSYKKIGFLSYMDEVTGEMEETVVDDGFRLDKKMKELSASIDWQWVTEIWEGTRIGADIYVDIHPLQNQCDKLPFVGYVYNNVNSTPTSLVDLIKPHQYTYMVTWWRLEQELAKAKGKKFVMDIAQLPKSKGWTVDQWMYYFDNLGVIWINSMEEGRKGDVNSVAKFNQFQSVDVSLSSVVGQYISILDKIEQQVVNITGVSPQREGDIGSSETATGAQRAIIQSNNVTKPLFFYHDLVKEAVLSYMVELCKVAYIDGEQMELVLDETEVETLHVDGDKLNATDFGVFINNSSEELERIEKLEQLAQVALQQDKAKLSDMISIIGSKSISKIKSTIIGSEREKEQAAQAAQKQQQEADMQIKQAEAEAAQQVQDREDIRQDKELNNKIQLAYISKGDGASAEEQAKLALEVTKHQDAVELDHKKLQLEDKKIELENKNRKEELKIKEQDIKVKSRQKAKA